MWCVNIKLIIDLFSGIMSLLVLLVHQFIYSQYFRILSAGYLYSCLTHTIEEYAGMWNAFLPIVFKTVPNHWVFLRSVQSWVSPRVSGRDTSIPCVSHKTYMRSTRVSQPWVLQSSCTLLSPKTMAMESRPFLLANDALIVQVNNLLFFPPMNNKEPERAVGSVKIWSCWFSMVYCTLV